MSRLGNEPKISSSEGHTVTPPCHPVFRLVSDYTIVMYQSYNFLISQWLYYCDVPILYFSVFTLCDAPKCTSSQWDVWDSCLIPEPVLRRTPPMQLEEFHTVISAQACVRSLGCKPSYTIVWLNTGLTEPRTARVRWPLTPLASGKTTLQQDQIHKDNWL